MANYLMGIDAGNTSSKVVIFDENGKIVSTEGTVSRHLKPRGEGFEEFDVDELWSMISQCIKSAVEKAGIAPSDLKGIGVTSFGNGVVFLDKDGNSIAPGCFSQDYRANCILEMYQKEGTYDKINEIVKGTMFAGEPGPILRWYKEYDREVYDKIGGVLTFKDLIMYRLTEVFATDMNVFGGSFMIDMDTMEYSKELLELYGIEELYDAMPKLASEPTEVVGYVTKNAAELTGLAEGTPVVAGMMDILACLVGAGATADNVYTVIAGSWSINETHSKRVIPNASSNMPYIRKGEYLNCSYTGASASNYEWFTKKLGGNAKLETQLTGSSVYDVLDQKIGGVDPKEAKVFFSPFVAQPSIHPNAKANFFNIDMNTSYDEICYAVAEGVAFIHKYHIDFLKNAELPLDIIRMTGGIAKSKEWGKIFANVFQEPIEVVECDETGALGSAIAAGIGTGVYKSYEEAFEKAVKIKRKLDPNPEMKEVYDKRYKEWTFLNDMMKNYWDKKGEF